MSIRLHYDSWPDTVLTKPHTHLQDMLKQLGEPTIIHRGPWSTYLEWLPIYPGVPIPTYILAEPWPTESPRRKLVRVSLENRP